MADDDMPEDLKRQLKEQEAAEAANHKDSSSDKGDKDKTFNSLDPRFQTTDKHDPEHIFPEELEMCKELRKARPELEKESDKFLVFFLCARRHVMADTLALLDKFLTKRKELGYDKKQVSHRVRRTSPPQGCSFADLIRLLSPLQDFEHVLKMGANLHPPGAIDKHGRLLHYYWIGKDRPKDRTLEEFYAYFFWQVDILLKTEPLKYLRNGFLFIVNMSGFGSVPVPLPLLLHYPILIIPHIASGWAGGRVWTCPPKAKKLTLISRVYSQ